MLKTAGPSSDPVQQKLRDNKKNWNKQVSTFINDLINFKKLMNGSPSKFFMEKGTIKEPIPHDPGTILGVLLHDYQEIATKGNDLIKEQIEYSKNRRKSQPKTPGMPAPTSAVPAPGAANLTDQLSAFDTNFDLVSLGSSPISRFFAKLLNPGFGFSEEARVRRYRLSLLSSCAKTFRALERVQVEIVKSSKDSIPSSHKLLQQAWEDWMVLYRGFTTYKSNMPATIPDAGGPISVEEVKPKEPEKAPIAAEVKPEVTTPMPAAPADYNSVAKSYIQDYKKALIKNTFPSKDIFTGLNNSIATYLMAPNAKKQEAAQEVIKSYQSVLTMLNQQYGVQLGSLQELATAKAPAPATPLESVAQDFLKKWVGKTRHKMSLFDNTSAYRLDIYKVCEEVRDILDKIMDSLEKDMNVEELSPLVMDGNRKIMALRGLTRAMNGVDNNITSWKDKLDFL